MAAGCSSLGILLGGGIGQVMAQWIVDGLPPIDISDVDIARKLPFQNSPRYLRDRTVELLGLTYAQGYFNLQKETPRNARKSPFHDRLADARAYFGYVGYFTHPFALIIVDCQTDMLNNQGKRHLE